MTNQEFSNTFTVLLNSYSGNVGDIVLDEYEKSVFLTEAQEKLVLNYYRGINIEQLSFEQSEELRRYLDSLVTTKKYTSSEQLTGCVGISSKSVFYSFPTDHMFTTYEAVTLSSDNTCMNGKELTVVPVNQDDYHSMSRNPFRSPDNRAYRLNTGSGIEIICDHTIDKYILRYVKVPAPIILTALPDGLSINGKSQETECALHPSLHREIVETAVQLALTVKASSTK